ncbi:nucleolar protein 16 [Camelus ferus]|nr:nucleolar protein 16 [Camelus ferus]
MPKAKGKTRRQKFGYSVNRKRLNRNARRKTAPRIECSHIRHAWDQTKSVRQNLAEMGLAMDPNKAVPLLKRKVKAMEVDVGERPKELVRKPYVLNGGSRKSNMENARTKSAATILGKIPCPDVALYSCRVILIDSLGNLSLCR